MIIYVGSLDFIRLCRPTADDVCSDGDICSTILIVATTKTSRHVAIHSRSGKILSRADSQHIFSIITKHHFYYLKNTIKKFVFQS